MLVYRSTKMKLGLGHVSEAGACSPGALPLPQHVRPGPGAGAQAARSHEGGDGIMSLPFPA